jgi:hypothetical protein
LCLQLPPRRIKVRGWILHAPRVPLSRRACTPTTASLF